MNPSHSELYFPRLAPLEARRLLASYSGRAPKDLKSLAGTASEHTYWYPTAPESKRVPVGVLESFAAGMRDCAAQFGYPRLGATKSDGLTAFDRAAVRELGNLLPMLPVEAASEDVWSFLTLIVAPDIALWRFPNRKAKEDYERLLGYPRNVFRRLWWRGYVFGVEEGQVGPLLWEDEAVAILERPSIGGNRTLAVEIAATHLRRFAKASGRTEILRDAMKRITRLSVFTEFHSLDESERRQLLDETFDAAELQITARKTGKKAN